MDPACGGSAGERLDTVFGAPKCQPRGEQRHKRHLIRRQNLPICPDHAQNRKGFRPSEASGDEMTGFQGVKRLHGDVEQMDFFTPGEARSRSRGPPAADTHKPKSKPTILRPNQTAGTPSKLGNGRSSATGASVKRQRGCAAAWALPSFDGCLNTLDSDIAEKEAEIRAEILDSVRQLLQDESEIDCLVQLRLQLQEKNTALLERAIHRRGVAECMQLLEETLEVEAKGGQLTAEGRRRTPGGVFLRLLQDRIPREDKHFIWDEQNREQRKFKRLRLRNQKAAGSCAPPHSRAICTEAVLPACRQATIDTECEEREPGELDENEIAALDAA